MNGAIYMAHVAHPIDSNERMLSLRDEHGRDVHDAAVSRLTEL